MNTYPVTKHHAMKTYEGVEVQLHAFLTLVLDEGKWSASHPGHFTPGESASGIHGIGSWIGRSGKEINSQPLSETEPQSSSPEPSCYTN